MASIPGQDMLPPEEVQESKDLHKSIFYSKLTETSTENGNNKDTNWPIQEGMTEWSDKTSENDCSFDLDALEDYNFDESSDEEVQGMPKKQRDKNTKKNTQNLQTGGITTSTPNPGKQSKKNKRNKKKNKTLAQHMTNTEIGLNSSMQNKNPISVIQNQGVKRTATPNTNPETKKMCPNNNSKDSTSTNNNTDNGNQSESFPLNKEENKIGLYTPDKYKRQDNWVVISDKNGVPFDQHQAKVLLQELEKKQYDLITRYENTNKKRHKILIPLSRYQPELKNGSLCIAPQNVFTSNWLKIIVQNLPSFWEGCEGYATSTMPFYHLGVIGFPDFFSPDRETLTEFLKVMNPIHICRLNIGKWKTFIHKSKKRSETPKRYDHIVAIGIPRDDHVQLERNQYHLNYKLTQVKVMSFDYKAYSKKDVEKILDDCEATLHVTLKKSTAVCEQDILYKECIDTIKAMDAKKTNLLENQKLNASGGQKSFVDQTMNKTPVFNYQQPHNKSTNETNIANLKETSLKDNSPESFGNNNWIIISDNTGKKLDENRANLLRKAIEKAQFDYVLNSTKSTNLVPVFKFEPELFSGSLCFLPQDNFTKNWLENTVKDIAHLWKKCKGFITTMEPFYYLGVVALPNFFSSDKESLLKFFIATNMRTGTRRSNLLSPDNWPVYSHRVKPNNDGFDHIIAMGVPVKDYNTLSLVKFRLNYKLTQVCLTIVEPMHYNECNAHHYNDGDIENAMDECEKSMDKTSIKESFDGWLADDSTTDKEQIGQVLPASNDRTLDETKPSDQKQVDPVLVDQATSDNLDISLLTDETWDEIDSFIADTRQPKDDRNMMITRKRRAEQTGLNVEGAVELKIVCDRLLGEFKP